MASPADQEAPRQAREVRSSYEALASSYDRRWRTYIDASLSRVSAVLSLRGDERILDVACGTGELERRLLARWPGLHIIGMDFSRGMLAQARTKHIAGAVAWIEADASRLPVGDGRFDRVICASSFHYFQEPAACLREFRRALAPGGQLILLDWCDDYWTCKLCGFWLHLTDPAYVHIYPMQALQDMLVDAGFTMIRSERFKVSWLWGMMLFVCERF
mgnify:CR=1 FL=1